MALLCARAWLQKLTCRVVTRNMQAAARAASERDRRALRTLRDGLADVEVAVSERYKRGFHQVGGVCSDTSHTCILWSTVVV